jgi:hypothetical protein
MPKTHRDYDVRRGKPPGPNELAYRNRRREIARDARRQDPTTDHQPAAA